MYTTRIIPICSKCKKDLKSEDYIHSVNGNSLETDLYLCDECYMKIKKNNIKDTYEKISNIRTVDARIPFNIKVPNGIIEYGFIQKAIALDVTVFGENWIIVDNRNHKVYCFSFQNADNKNEFKDKFSLIIDSAFESGSLSMIQDRYEAIRRVKNYESDMACRASAKKEEDKIFIY